MSKSHGYIKDSIKWTAVFLLVLGLLGAVISLFVMLDRQTSTTTIGGEAYSIGTIDESGEYAESNSSIYTRKAIPTDGLTCRITDDATITYRIFFYDEDGEFLSATSALSADYDGTGIPVGADTAKIVITPTEDEDGVVSFTEILSYASQLTVTVNK